MGAVRAISDAEIAAELAAGREPAFGEHDPPISHLQLVTPTRRAVPLEEVVARSAPVVLADEVTLALVPELRHLFPGGALVRGTTVSVSGVGAASLAWAVAAGPSAEGSWVATVGLESLGLVAAAEMGVAFERLAVIASPPLAQWGAVVASLIGAFDVVLVAAPRRVRPTDARRLAARSRERGTVLVVVDLAHVLNPGDSGPQSSGAATLDRSAIPVDVALTTTDAVWEGVGHGHGHLRQRRVHVVSSGRRAAAQPRRSELLLPGPNGIALVGNAG